jgi:hypothetical protein
MKKKNIGSTFDSWLREESLYEKAGVAAIKRHRRGLMPAISSASMARSSN